MHLTSRIVLPNRLPPPATAGFFVPGHRRYAPLPGYFVADAYFVLYFVLYNI